jgi:hypothetical protein
MSVNRLITTAIAPYRNGVTVGGRRKDLNTATCRDIEVASAIHNERVDRVDGRKSLQRRAGYRPCGCGKQSALGIITWQEFDRAEPVTLILRVRLEIVFVLRRQDRESPSSRVLVQDSRYKNGTS